MGAETFIQVFNEAKEKLSRELLSPNDSLALTPLKQLKLLYAMLNQVLKASDGTNIHLTDTLDALKAAITNPSANGERELPDSLSRTPGANPYSSTKKVTRDGAEFRVYPDPLIVAPNIVNFQERDLHNVSDWLDLISGMQQRNQWTAKKGKNPKTVNQILESVDRSNGKQKSKAPTTNYKAHVNIAPSSFSKSELEGDTRA